MIFRRNDRLCYISRERGAELGSARPTKGAKENAEGEKGRKKPETGATRKRTRLLVIPDFTGIKELITRIHRAHD